MRIKKECRSCKSCNVFYNIAAGTYKETDRGECTARIKIVALGDKCHLWRERPTEITAEALDQVIENINAIMQIYEGN
ncbi:MAG: hypothetical protein J1F36_05140 [Clostridiales bacterium]|nr:hypothetical protein [Clostridiales bacterium]